MLRVHAQYIDVYVILTIANTQALLQMEPAEALHHAVDELIDVLLAVAGVAALDEVVADAREAADGAVHLERPEELGALLQGGRMVSSRRRGSSS